MQMWMCLLSPENPHSFCRVVCASVCVCVCVCVKVCVHYWSGCFNSEVGPWISCVFVGCNPLACATIYHANARLCLFMYELAAFRPMLFLTVMVISMCSVFSASLNDNGSARCFTSRHTSPDLVWECWHWAAESEMRLANRRWFTFCAKLMCFAFHMVLCVHQGVFTICSHHCFDRGQ